MASRQAKWSPPQCSSSPPRSCFHVVWNQEREKAGLDQDMSEDTSASVKVAVEGLKKIIQRDRELAALPNHDQKLLEKKEKGLLHE